MQSVFTAHADPPLAFCVLQVPCVQVATVVHANPAGLLQTFGLSLQSAADVHAPLATPLLFW